MTIAYGKDDVRDFGDFLVRAQRDNGKTLVLDVEQQLKYVREQTRTAQTQEVEQSRGHEISRVSRGRGR